MALRGPWDTVGREHGDERSEGERAITQRNMGVGMTPLYRFFQVFAKPIPAFPRNDKRPSRD